ncbi:riboflavin synthase [Bacillus sp. (in: firmicutes)]|uniref:riboflavin synthase n=1 Tax=Bacillus sp. TaxID=1409 RepID=UPI00180A6EDD|nr:riboflavin synthase [Bacillus sp. (in: firmicutes)]NWN81054.1 riboflavin synthase [Bacillus sp. (in: firmicutes)]
MFTGIIEEKGKILSLQRVSKEAIILKIKSHKVVDDVHVGDSIAVNGTCLTVTSFDKHSFSVEVMPETMKATSLQFAQVGSNVNLERAMAANARFGGHFVSGHVDGLGKIIRRQPEQNAIYLDIEIPVELTKYLVKKGSIAVDGVSLTIFNIRDHVFTISLIPHTAMETILGERKQGDKVNIECDMLMKHVEKLFMKNVDNEPITKKLLFDKGFN